MRALRRHPRARRAHAPGYFSLFGRILLATAVVLGAGVAAFALLAPDRVSEVAADEVLIVTLCVVAIVNVLIVRRIVVPLQRLTAFARGVDATHPGTRFPDAEPTSEAGELALTFNEMLERLERERAQSARSVLAAHEAERLRVAQELHDEVGQTLTAVLLQLSRVHGRAGERLRPEVTEAQEAVRTSLEDVRRIAAELRPETLNDLGLPSALATLGDSFSRRTGISVRRQIEADLPPMRGETELAVYRVAQEALTNVARHSGSDRAELSLTDGTGHLTLTVRDYGPAPMDADPAEGNGIRGMRERASALGGTLAIDRPRHGPGHEVVFEVPVGAGA